MRWEGTVCCDRPGDPEGAECRKDRRVRLQAAEWVQWWPLWTSVLSPLPAARQPCGVGAWPARASSNPVSTDASKRHMEPPGTAFSPPCFALVTPPVILYLGMGWAAWLLINRKKLRWWASLMRWGYKQLASVCWECSLPASLSCALMKPARSWATLSEPTGSELREASG